MDAGRSAEQQSRFFELQREQVLALTPHQLRVIAQTRGDEFRKRVEEQADSQYRGLNGLNYGIRLIGDSYAQLSGLENQDLADESADTSFGLGLDAEEVLWHMRAVVRGGVTPTRLAASPGSADFGLSMLTPEVQPLYFGFSSRVTVHAGRMTFIGWRANVHVGQLRWALDDGNEESEDPSAFATTFSLNTGLEAWFPFAGDDNYADLRFFVGPTFHAAAMLGNRGTENLFQAATTDDQQWRLGLMFQTSLRVNRVEVHATVRYVGGDIPGLSGWSFIPSISFAPGATLRRWCRGVDCLDEDDEAVDTSHEHANLIGRPLHADYSGHNFRSARLIRAQMEGGTFDGADFTDADMTGANIDRASFRGAVLCGVAGLDTVENFDPQYFAGAKIDVAMRVRLLGSEDRHLAPDATDEEKSRRRELIEGLDTCPVRCGDGRVETGEQCDDGNTKGEDGCSASCQLEALYSCAGQPSVCDECGNGVVGRAETCDEGDTTAGDGCSATCQVEICGNGILDPNEACDDGDTNGADGCSATCQVEAGYSCTVAQPSVCDLCGDGTVGGGETCDDGNTTAGDGCSASCRLEPGYSCDDSEPSVCNLCGDGVIGAKEGCDDANTAAGDGCSASCQPEAGWSCLGAPSVCTQ
tara:strand:+ start:1782 stop:3704 length:1923 start_codon:yes stop_codon:yes gene_type:complete